MSNIQAITDAQLPALDVFRRLADRDLKRREGLFVTEGVEAVRRLLKSDLDVHSLLVTPRRLEQLRDALPARAVVYVADRALMETVIGFPVNRGGAIACAARPDALDLDTVVARGCTGRQATVVAMENINDAQNVGLIVRNAVAFGAGAAVLANCCDPLYRRAVRVSMGSVFRLPFHLCDGLAGPLRRLREVHGFAIVAAVVSNDATPLSSVRPTDRTVLVFGSEGAGLSTETLAVCDKQVVIPMAPDSDSVNVAVASGIFLYHFAGTEVGDDRA
jgi:tRNA G18 (ribose-2'-O)-methylase SpoU